MSISRQQLIDDLYQYHEDNGIGYMNHSIFSDEELKIKHDILINNHNLIPNIHLFNNKLKGFIYAVTIVTEDDDDLELFCINEGSKLGNSWCLFQKAQLTKNKDESISLYRKILDEVPFASIWLAEILYKNEMGDKNEIIDLYTRHLRYIKDGIIIKSHKTIPGELLIEVMDRFNYQNFRKYMKISDIIKQVVSINELVNIIMQYY